MSKDEIQISTKEIDGMILPEPPEPEIIQEGCFSPISGALFVVAIVVFFASVIIVSLMEGGII